MNREEKQRRRTFARRAAILAAGKLGLMAALGGRLYQLQILDGDRYRTQAEENRINLRLLAPSRGAIVDRAGVELARNRRNYCLVLAPEEAGDLERALDAVARWVPIDDEARERVLREAARRRPFASVLVSEHLSWRQVAAVEVNAPELPGVSIEVRRTRDYPHGPALAHVLGYVGAAAPEEAEDDPLLSLPGFPVGKNGAEKTHDAALRGGAGSLQVEVNAHGRVIRELDRREGPPGRDVRLTVDLGLQRFAAGRLEGESASAVLLDVRGGGVLALVSAPAFDPNAFSRGIAAPDWRRLVDNPRAPLTNKAVSGQYPPGSVFKLAVALAALEAGAVDPGDRVFCSGRIVLGDRAFHCWKRGGHGWMDMRDGIAQSCDVYFYDIALKAGIERIAAMAARLGFGERLGVELPNEARGLVPTPGWKRAVKGEPWYRGETLGVGIGQSFVLATPLQLATMAARLADGARAVTSADDPRRRKSARRAAR